MKYLSFIPLEIEDSSEATIESAAIDLSQILKVSIQAVVGAGTITGSIQLQVSNDIIENGYLMKEEPVNWSNLGSSLALSAQNTNYLIAQQDVCYRALRVVFTGNPLNDAPVTIQLMALAI